MSLHLPSKVNLRDATLASCIDLTRMECQTMFLVARDRATGDFSGSVMTNFSILLEFSVILPHDDHPDKQLPSTTYKVHSMSPVVISCASPPRPTHNLPTPIYRLMLEYKFEAKLLATHRPSSLFSAVTNARLPTRVSIKLIRQLRS